MARGNRGFGYWAVIVLAVVMALFGLPILAGGVWLITLGGSWYYALAGLGLLATAWFLFRHSMLAVWTYLLTFVGTLIWALWERGFDGWAQPWSHLRSSVPTCGSGPVSPWCSSPRA